MIKHLVMWSFKEGFTVEEKQQFAQEFKERVEALKGIVPGLIELTLHISPEDTSNRDLFLDSTLVDAEALAGYQVHPEHVAVGAFIKPFAEQRVCFDYQIVE